jgi:hypothetical protein
MGGNYTTLLTILLAAGSFALSLYTLWLTQLHRGQVRMTRPTLVFIARERDDGRYKIFLRTHLFCSSIRGRVIENMYVSLRNKAGVHLFDFWGYGESERLSLGSGLFVGQTGVTYNHHFVLRRDDEDFLFWDGEYQLEVFAHTVGDRRPIRLMEINLSVDGQMSAEMVQIRDLGAYFEWDAEQGKYLGRVERRDRPSGP